MENIKAFFQENQWEIAHRLSTPGRERQLCASASLPLSSAAQRYLDALFPEGIYGHQFQALQLALQGENICLSTGTASGKSLVFYVNAIECLQRDPKARVIAIYPMKALGAEQEARWQLALQAAGLVDVKVGRIDGSVKPMYRRSQILGECRVVVCTPDILHAWFLSNLNDKKVRSFLSHVSLIIVDEVHSYTGVFGSNAAFLFRRLQHLMSLWGTTPRFICASATIAKPEEHLNKLFGLPFRLISQDSDTSPRQELNIYLVTPPDSKDFLSSVVQLLGNLAQNEGTRFITFVDSRRQVELISSILARRSSKAGSGDAESDDSSDAETDLEVEDELPGKAFDAELLDRLQVLPYRAGYEESDRRRIQQRLSQGVLSGVVSTSALELGIDIQELDVCVLVGVPNSATSLFQRIGRVGRHAPATVVVINSGDVLDQAVFAHPENFLNRPLAESALYLENPYIQYIHALCLARFDGEHDQAASKQNGEGIDHFTSPVDWPEQYLNLCQQERLGQIPRTLQSMKTQASDSPNYEFPLRDVESQFKVELKQGPNIDSLGSLSYGQVMREAYPGAVYYYATQPYRVLWVKTRSKQIVIKKTRHYTTRPILLPTQVFPNLNGENVYIARRHDDLLLVECDLQVREVVCGVRERRGRTETTHQYPLQGQLGVTYDPNFFVRNYFTTGVVISHPCLKETGVELSSLAALIFEAFLITIPFERQDINFADDKYRTSRPPVIAKDERFLAVYDQTYGSLRLTSRLMEETVFSQVMGLVRELALNQEIAPVNAATLDAIETILKTCQTKGADLQFGDDKSIQIARENQQVIRIILPGSTGLNLNRENEEFKVKRVFYGPNGLCYEGITQSLASQAETTTSYPFVDEIAEIPGISEMGLYDVQTGEIKKVKPAVQILEARVSPAKQVDLTKLEIALRTYFSSAGLQSLCSQIGIRYEDLPGQSQEEKVGALIKLSYAQGKEVELLQCAFQAAQRKYR